MEDSVNVLKLAEARAAEIKTLMDKVHSSSRPVLQRLPYHMRRRAASHNPKRIPRNLRKKAEENLAKPGKNKKHKKHKNLQEEYLSRQKPGASWLPTHIWFAKRFHMKNMFGYKLPFQATGKRFRSSYRATVKSTLVQDLSYFCCIELRGTQEKLLTNLSALTDDSIGKNFAAESFIDGTKEGTCFLYHPNSFPFGAIGPVSFLWKPVCMLPGIISSETRQLWIWCHPAIHEELLSALVKLFNLDPVPDNDDSSKKKYTFASQHNFVKTKLHFQKEPVFVGGGVTLTDLKDTLVRHRVLGPNASAVLTSILKHNDSYYSLPLGETDIGSPAEGSSEGKTGKDSRISSQDLIRTKQRAWQNLTEVKSSYFIPMNSVFGLNVDDPRVYVTPKNSGFSLKDDSTIEILPEVEFFSPDLAYSEIWDQDVRNQVTAAQTPEHVINHEKSKYVVPNASDLLKCLSPVPVIVIYQPAVNGYGSGWDIIVPQGWGMAFWIPLVYHGAQPGGFEDYCCINFESGRLTFPISFPDTKAGAHMEENSREDNLKKFYRYSRAKRPNFQTLGISNPYFMPWRVLLDDWEKEFCCRREEIESKSQRLENLFESRDVNEVQKGEFFTVRSWREIFHLTKLCSELAKSRKQLSSVTAASLQNLLDCTVCSLLNSNIYLKSLVAVRVKCLFRGTPFQFSGIYMPKEADLDCLREDPKCHGPVEPQHSLRDEYLEMPASKRRKVLKEEAKAESKKLDRPEVETIISNAGNKLIGYVSEGGYSRLNGQGSGLGHCSLTGFLTVLELCLKKKMPATVLVREQHVFQYRLATIEVVENPF